MTEESGKIIIHGDPDLKELIPGYLEDMNSDVGALRDALGSGDYETIRMIGHMMKGNGEGYGFPEITGIGSALEGAAINRDADEIRRQTDELASYLERVDVIYE